MNFQARILSKVLFPHDPPSYIITIPHAADPTRSTKLTVPIKAAVRTKFEAQTAAMNEIDELTDGDLQVLLHVQAKATDPLARGAN